MKNSGKFENSMRAVTINSEFSLPGLTVQINYFTCRLNILIMAGIKIVMTISS